MVAKTKNKPHERRFTAAIAIDSIGSLALLNFAILNSCRHKKIVRGKLGYIGLDLCVLIRERRRDLMAIPYRRWGIPLVEPLCSGEAFSPRIPRAGY